MTEKTTVLLAGASGVFGRHITSVLSAHGYQVLGLGRGPDNEVRADLTNRDQLLHAVQGRHADIVVHAATALQKPPAMHRDMAATDALRTTGMHNFVEAAHELGATRMIGENMVFGYGYGEHGTTPLTEAAEFGPVQRNRHLSQHVEAMKVKEQLTLTTPGIAGISLRFGLFYGPGGIESTLTMLRRRMLPAPGSGPRTLPWVHLRDAADAVLAAIELGSPGQAYNIADDVPMGFGQQIEAMATAFGTPRPLRVPTAMMRPAPLFYAMLRTGLRVDSTKARTELGWRPSYPDAVTGLTAMAQGVAP
jgi:nucleoside-diphosphate-sugar epimerase